MTLLILLRLPPLIVYFFVKMERITRSTDTFIYLSLPHHSSENWRGEERRGGEMEVILCHWTQAAYLSLPRQLFIFVRPIFVYTFHISPVNTDWLCIHSSLLLYCFVSIFPFRAFIFTSLHLLLKKFLSPIVTKTLLVNRINLHLYRNLRRSKLSKFCTSEVLLKKVSKVNTKIFNL